MFGLYNLKRIKFSNTQVLTQFVEISAYII